MPSGYSAFDGKYLDPVAKTNVNKVVSLFETKIEGYQDFQKTIEGSRDRSLGSISSDKDLQSLSESLSLQSSQHETKKLENIKATDLDIKGREQGVSTPWIDECFTDYSAPGMLEHRRDMDEIILGTNNMMKPIFEVFKEIGVDCKAAKGNKEIEPEYHIHLEQRMERDKGNTKYDQVFCERLRNQYNCQDLLSLKCSNITSKPSNLSMTGTNLPVIENRVGFARFGSHNPHWLSGGDGTLYDYYVTFNISNPLNISYFRIGGINYDDWVLIKLNGNYIWSGPRGGLRLDFADSGPSLGFRAVAIDNSGQCFSTENDTWFYSTLNIDMKPYLKEGSNTLSIRLIVGGYGGILFDLSLADKECSAWTEDWSEKCTLN